MSLSLAVHFFSEQLKIQTVTDNAQAAKDSKILLLSVKPYQLRDILPPIGAVLSPMTPVISIAAGVRSAAIEQSLGQGKPWRIVLPCPILRCSSAKAWSLSPRAPRD